MVLWFVMLFVLVLVLESSALTSGLEQNTSVVFALKCSYCGGAVFKVDVGIGVSTEEFGS